MPECRFCAGSGCAACRNKRSGGTQSRVMVVRPRSATGASSTGALSECETMESGIRESARYSPSGSCSLTVNSPLSGETPGIDASGSAGKTLGFSVWCGFWCFAQFTICTTRSSPTAYRRINPSRSSEPNIASTSRLSAGNSAIFNRFGRSSRRPSRSASVHSPINNSRVAKSSSTRSSLLKNPGLILRALAITAPPGRASAPAQTTPSA